MSGQPVVEVREYGTCPSCGSDLPPSVRMTQNGPENRCSNPECRMPWPDMPEEKDMVPPLPPPPQRQTPRPAERPQAPVRAPEPKVAPKAVPKDILGLAKQRLAEVKSELRRLDALQKERDELERMIAAARKGAA